MNEIEFEVIGEIKQKQRPRASFRNGFATVYTPKETISYENYIRSCYLNKYGNFHFDEDVALRVDMQCYYKRPDNFKKYDEFIDDDAVDELACLKHKDVDNTLKVVLDALNKILWLDDKQVTTVFAHKQWTKNEEKLVITVSRDYPLTEKSVKEKVRINDLFRKLNELLKNPKPNKSQLERINKIREELTTLGAFESENG